MNKYDIIIIGGGASGLSCAFTGKGFNKKVAIIEEKELGGECTWSGCIPSKALINIAKEVFITKKYSEIEIDTKEVLKKVRSVIENIYKEENEFVLKNHGIEVIKGRGEFQSKNTIKVNDVIYTAKKFIIATGSSPFIPTIEGLNEVDFLTNENIFNLEELPKSLIVLGGGAIGVELSQALNRLGVEVTLLEMMDTIMFREDSEMLIKLSGILEKEGVKLRTKTKAVKVKKNGYKIILTIEKNGQYEEIIGDKILVAVGRRANVEKLNLEKIGVETNTKGVVVNNKLETNIKNIFACGDVVGPYQFSHMANYQGILATTNAILPFKRKVNYTNVPWCTFTEPELARVGLTEKEAKEKYPSNSKVYTISYDKLDRAKTELKEKGFVKIIVNKKGRILGAHILGERAGELITEIQILKTLKMDFAKLQNVIHPYPTYGEILKKLSKEIYLDRILNNPLVKVFNKKKT